MAWKLKRISKSPMEGKKLRATFEDAEKGREKHTDFGATGYDDFTKTKNLTQRNAYRIRHSNDLNTGDPTRAGFLSYYILWNKPTISASVADYRHRFNM